MDVIGYAGPRVRVRWDWLGWEALAALVGVLHFSMSVGLWQMFLRSEVRPGRVGEVVGVYWMGLVPAFGMFALAVWVYWLALTRRRGMARRMLIVLVVGAGAFFWEDTRFGRYQVEVGIATREYWDAGGVEHAYATWWWYNDRWGKGRR